MMYGIWQTPTMRFGDVYDPDADWRCVWTGVESDTRSSAEQVCEALFVAFQRVDDEHTTPPGYQGRSLTAGDLISLRDEEQEPVWWFCCNEGWERVNAPGCVSA